MASRDEHDLIGGMSGGLAATVRLRNEESPTSGWHIIAEILGGIAGGVWGARLPDMIEPPTSPNHRSVAHSIAATTLLSFAATTRAPAIAQRMTSTTGDNDVLREFLMRFVAGMVVGAPVGYVSHTLADATTPKGLPLLG